MPDFEAKYKHYVRVDGESRVTKAFSSCFEEAQPEDKLVEENEQAHYSLDIMSIDGAYNYKWDAEEEEVVARTAEEKQPEIDAVRKATLFDQIRSSQKELDALANLKTYTDMPELDVNAKMAELESARDVAITEYNEL